MAEQQPPNDPGEALARQARVDVQGLRDAATAARDSLGELLNAPPTWLSSDERTKLESIWSLCEVLAGSTERALRALGGE
ncbi:MAG TPA: hypothetical protein VFC09_15750 [Candidatus Dormibacteraeota bacterium]|nr:hypothetical protein [Candidatus Dormibacteraeota bacterium]